MQAVFIGGLSGSGKSIALNVPEDPGYHGWHAVNACNPGRVDVTEMLIQDRTAC